MYDPVYTYNPEAATECTLCAPGTYDDDNDPGTVCFQCGQGTYTVGELAPCGGCIVGSADLDLDPESAPNIRDWGSLQYGDWDRSK